LIPPDDELEELTDQFDFDEVDYDQDATVINSGDSIDEQPTVVLPMTLLSLAECGMTDIGMKRSHNEDCFAVEKPRLISEKLPKAFFVREKDYFLCVMVWEDTLEEK